MTEIEKIAKRRYPEMGFEIADQNIKHLRRGFIEGAKYKSEWVSDAVGKIQLRLLEHIESSGAHSDFDFILEDLDTLSSFLSKLPQPPNTEEG